MGCMSIIAILGWQMTIPVIPIPYQFTGASLSRVIAGVVDNSPTGLPPELHFDFRPLNFIHPDGVVLLSNLFHWLHQKKTKVILLNLEQPSEAVRFLDDSLFFEQHVGRKLLAYASPRSTTRPLKQITRDKCHDWLENDLIPWLSGKLKLSPASFAALKTSISEIFNNIRDHAKLNVGSIFVQFFPKQNRINIAVADFGPGIPATVARVQKGLTDSQAIMLAVEDGFTTKSVPTNMGVGLDYLLKTAVLTNGGHVTIYSNQAIVTFVNRDGAISGQAHEDVGFIPGTTIDICLRTDTFEMIEDEREDFRWD